MEFTKEEIGLKLRQMRLDKNMTQQEVAKLIGRNQPIIGHWESGYAQPDANTLFKLCAIYGVYDIGAAFGLEEQKKPATENGDGPMSPLDAQLMGLLRFLSDDQKRMLLAQIQTLLESQSQT